MPEAKPMRLEVCLDSPDGLAVAIAGGADRIELCATLALGGLTPSPGFMHIAREAPTPVYAMIRPREGGFCYTDAELRQMCSDIDTAREIGLAGVVIGCAMLNDCLDVAAMRRLMSHATGLGVTIHRVFDLVPDRDMALEQVIDLGIERVLTSGGASTAETGVDALQHLVQQARDRIVIMPGSGVNAGNVQTIQRVTGAREIHASCSVATKPETGAAQRMGYVPETPRKTVDKASVQALKQAMLQQ